MDMVRQGDILLVKCSRPVGDRYMKVEECKSDIVAQGEATNHHHRISGDATLWRMGREMYVYCADPASAQMTHEEHGTVTLEEEGWYKVTRQREYTPRRLRYVRD